MRVVVTGSTGVIGRSAIPQLVHLGHDVIAAHRRPEAAGGLRGLGATPALVDLFDAGQVNRLVQRADAVVHLATAIPPLGRMSKASSWVDNDRLRDDATRALVEASRAAGVAVFVQESVTFNYLDAADRWIDEDHPVAPTFVATASALAAERHVATLAATDTRGVVLRMSQLYGPGRVSTDLVDALRHRRVPQVGTGTNYVSSLHIDDAGSAVAASLGLRSGLYNVSDDMPLTSDERLAVQVRGVGAAAPRHIPAVVARMVVGRAARLLTLSQRVSNRRFRQAANWQPRYRSISDGWATVTNSLNQTRAVQP